MNARGVDTAKKLADGDFDHALENAIEFGMIEGVALERARIAAIMSSPEARHCQATALMLALHDGGLTVACVRDILKAVPDFDAPSANIVDVAARRAALKVIENGDNT
jgi:hypothetical protein